MVWHGPYALSNNKPETVFEDMKHANGDKFRHACAIFITFLAFMAVVSALNGYLLAFAFSFSLTVVVVLCYPFVVVYMVSAIVSVFANKQEILNPRVDFPLHTLFTTLEVKREVLDFISSTSVCWSGTWQLQDVNEHNAANFPVLFAALKACPTVITCSICVLKPNFKIGMHATRYSGVMRYMFGITVPSTNLAWLKLNNRKIYLTEAKDVLEPELEYNGAGMLWDGNKSSLQMLCNTSATELYVLIYMDVLRTTGLPCWLQRVNAFVASIINSQRQEPKPCS